mmetsp:Transcript_10227/g.22054  ORF Transcript_10227/g.22054 Transcript_10227/m.22054 type:complete len:264 (-) Transcript_10227:552-1343(-)
MVALILLKCPVVEHGIEPQDQPEGNRHHEAPLSSHFREHVFRRIPKLINGVSDLQELAKRPLQVSGVASFPVVEHSRLSPAPQAIVRLPVPPIASPGSPRTGIRHDLRSLIQRRQGHLRTIIMVEVHLRHSVRAAWRIGHPLKRVTPRDVVVRAGVPEAGRLICPGTKIGPTHLECWVGALGVGQVGALANPQLSSREIELLRILICHHLLQIGTGKLIHLGHSATGQPRLAEDVHRHSLLLPGLLLPPIPNHDLALIHPEMR